MVPREDKDTADEVQPETAVAASWDMPSHYRRSVVKEQQQLTRVQRPQASSLANLPPVPARERHKIVGTKSGTDTLVKPGVAIVQKCVFHIDNLDFNCSPALLTDYRCWLMTYKSFHVTQASLGYEVGRRENLPLLSEFVYEQMTSKKFLTRTSRLKVSLYEGGSLPRVVMAGSNRIRLIVASYNLHGFNQGRNVVSSLCDTYDILFVQEHWLKVTLIRELMLCRLNDVILLLLILLRTQWR